MIIKQYNYTNIDDVNDGIDAPCKIGVSISEDDYFSYRPFEEEYDPQQDQNPYITLGNQGFHFFLKENESDNDEPIYIGLTYKYQSDTFLEKNKIYFPNNMQIPKSILIQRVME